MKKIEFDEIFKVSILPLIAIKYEKDGMPDVIARTVCYTYLIDACCKEGIITDKQYNDWCMPDHLETKKL
tara:strand:+ start:480 stop:689 length:210 start_codon:yes stop_codon:yes gene_type:complete